MDQKKKIKPKNSVPALNNWAKYTGLAIQMGVIIAAGAWGGQQLDKKFGTEKPVFSVICMLLAVFGAIYLAIKDFLFKKN
jgi:uncharacterized membrane protein YeaQ/YmgE (transglycosylase-associated protein family)